MKDYGFQEYRTPFFKRNKAKILSFLLGFSSVITLAVLVWVIILILPVAIDRTLDRADVVACREGVVR